MSNRYWDEKEKDLAWWPIIRDGAIVGVLGIASAMYGCPQYHVWEQGLRGQAELRRAEQNRQVAIQEATAKEESAKHLARAEIERAKGVSESNKIIGDSLKGNEAYLRYLWIHSLESDKQKTVVYIPTEANLPLLEASRTAR